MSKKSNYIKKFINSYANETIQERGLKLFLNSAIKNYTYNKIGDFYTFKVQGTLTYTTIIYHLSKFNLSTSCTCPFTYGVICKHTIAALLFLSNNTLPKVSNTKPIKKKKIVYRKKAGRVFIGNFENITNDVVKKFTTQKILERTIYESDISIKNVMITDKKITFHLEKKSYYCLADIFEVTFKKNKKKLEIQTTESTNVKEGFLKQTEVYCLLELIKTNSNDFFDVLFNKNKEINEKYTKTYGLKTSYFDDYFQIVYEVGDGLKLQKKPKAYGLISINSADNSYDAIFKDISKPINPTLVLNKLKNKEKLIGFTLSLNNYKKYDYNVISGKPNKTKTKLISKINEFNQYDYENVLINNKQQKIIDLINQIKQTDEIDEYSFNLSKQIFKHLSLEPFLLLNMSSYSVRKQELLKVEVFENPIKVCLNIIENEQFLEAKINLKINNVIIDIEKIDFENSSSLILSYKNVLHHLESYKDVLLINNFPKGLKITKEHKETFFNKVIKPMSTDFEINFEKNTFEHHKIKLDYKTEQIFISEKEDHIIIHPQVVYDNDMSILLTNKGNYIHKEENSNTVIEYVRNMELENNFINKIAGFHPNFEEQKSEKYFYLSFENFTTDLWFYKFFDILNTSNIEIFGLKDLENFKYSPFKGKVSTSIKSNEDWFEVSIDVAFGDNTVSLSDIRKAVINKKKYIQLKDGSVGLLPEEWLGRLKKYFRTGEVKGNYLAISKLKYSIIDELFDVIDETKILEEIALKRKKITQFKEISKTKVPKEIKAELRDYQKEGLNWLNFLDEMSWGGILADDMGLGKTLQILTFIQHIIKKDKTTNLIVLPTSLLFNWKAEIEKFAPKLKIYLHYGTDRNTNTKGFNKFNIIFTTYGTLLRDIEYLNKYKFNYIILDESQAIKNPASRRYKAVNLIKAKNRIALTGTPIENSTFDLFAQMNFVNPGIFGSVNNFKLNYSNPIDKEGNEIIANELQRIINPFILRRTKEKVAKELPPKTEDVLYCEMESEQRKIYDAYKNNYRNKLLKNVEEKGLGKSKLMVLEALTRLRQICDSPSLIKNVDYTNQAIKIKEIVNHITQKTANHKILIFSQFVGMLSLIKEELNRLNISYEYLDGKSNIKKRENSVNNFQNNNELRVFLISLKAGGTGLNLTAADYVYIVDPWWNPAVENQAIDRCYRIGQNKTVFAYRMICKNTIEEKILNLQAKKKKLAADIIQTDENIMKNLSVNDIKDLFG